ncbi:hypothetical protein B0T25DRAFT_536756 [Lasiosphaeria hispida]|uniref:Uncharacterized protein n=1 Tax=Lasiosphaeria hispida TaxID=260671 RepID=A0AAJ0MF89_9PEZI|nr:hypothetical protein B0T25DRAFT_536756 [Lasiosphaeria hispida]
MSKNKGRWSFRGKEKTQPANFQNRSLALPATLIPIKQLPPPSSSRPSTAPFRSSPPVSFHRRRSSYHNNCHPSSPRSPPQSPHTPTSSIPLRHRLSGSTERSFGNRSLKRVPSCVSASAVSRPSTQGSTKLSRPSRTSISSQVSNESVTGVAESLEAIAALVSGAKGRLEKRSRLPRQGASGEHGRLVGILQEIEGRVEYYQEVLGALRGKVEYSYTEHHLLVLLHNDMKIALRSTRSEDCRRLLQEELQRKNYTEQLDKILGSGDAIGRLAVSTAVR